MNSQKSAKHPPCQLLKAKNSFGMLEQGGESWAGIEDPNAQYWCIRTAGAIGPDNGLVGPDVCVRGRKCYR